MKAETAWSLGLRSGCAFGALILVAVLAFLFEVVSVAVGYGVAFRLRVLDLEACTRFVSVSSSSRKYG